MLPHGPVAPGGKADRRSWRMRWAGEAPARTPRCCEAGGRAQAAGQVPGGPRRPGAGERMPARNHPGAGASAGGQAPERRGGARQCVPGCRGAAAHNRVRSDQQPQSVAPRSRYHAGQGPIRPVQFRAARPPPLRHSELVAQDQDLGGPPGLLTPGQPQPCSGPRDQEKDEPQAHDR
jgi:hypothetical protein